MMCTYYLLSKEIIMSNAFAAAIAAAEKHQAKEISEREQAVSIRNKRMLHEFGEKFLAAVAKKVVKEYWKPDFVRTVQQYCEDLLLRTDPEKTPKLSDKLQERILEKFAYGIKLAKDRGVQLPDDFFYGQRLLKERQLDQSPSGVTQDNPNNIIAMATHSHSLETPVSRLDSTG